MEINKMNKAQLIEVCEYYGFPKEEWEQLKAVELKEYVNSLMESIKNHEEVEMEATVYDNLEEMEKAIAERELELEQEEKISKEEQKEILIDLMNSEEEEAPMDTYETLETPELEQKPKSQPKKVKLFDKFLKRIK